MAKYKTGGRGKWTNEAARKERAEKRMQQKIKQRQQQESKREAKSDCDEEEDSLSKRTNVPKEAYTHDSFTEAAIQNQLLSEETTTRDAGTRALERGIPTDTHTPTRPYPPGSRPETLSAIQGFEAILVTYETSLVSKDAAIQRLEDRNKVLEVVVKETFMALKVVETLKEKYVRNLNEQVETLEKCIHDLTEVACSEIVVGPWVATSPSR
ncbi:hypothetical protein BU16DRAFT_554742 [Lophium mytilinum]|uniref:Uncharacterized protein n=1 Tax=Lophium mytilinum TaxID=390894 RepID=A0A6A6RGX0_9PEZI|nr:hypothetical protein BU16DRAFT_554742 [Lophium mytilinum]